jgi:hypothetical protein
MNYFIPILFIIVWIIVRIFGGSKQNGSPTPFNGEVEDAQPNPFDELFSEESMEQNASKMPYKRDDSSRYKEILEQEKADLLNVYLKESNKQSTKQIDQIKKPSTPLLSNKKESSVFKAEVLGLLKGPYAMKKAFLAYEILGQPVGQRQNGKMGPSWE